ncbi:hypothetical protein OIU85_021080 [Salix viminalis]|uniref:Uncharacterized protein n=1 Tax=Salix viminalis TaxID=40686 RepID=A0A9Q0UHS4_SALVM|nr:hypothetical protein OIU85_021080 [Salix viminalis]
MYPSPLKMNSDLNKLASPTSVPLLLCCVLRVLLHEKIKERFLAEIINGGGRSKSTITRVPDRFGSSIVNVVHHEWPVQLLPPLGKGTFPIWSLKRGQSFPHRRRYRTFAAEIFTPSCEVEEKPRPEPSSFDARGSSTKVYSNGMSMRASAN